MLNLISFRYVEIYLAGAGHINSMLALGRAAEDHLYGPPRNGSYQQEPPQHHPQPTNGYRDGQQSFRLLMRGLPWHVSEREIEEVGVLADKVAFSYAENKFVIKLDFFCF